MKPRMTPKRKVRLAIAFATICVLWLTLMATGLITVWVSTEDCHISCFIGGYTTMRVSWSKGDHYNKDGTKTVYWCRPEFLYYHFYRATAALNKNELQ